MKVTKNLEQNKIKLYAIEGNTFNVITLDNEQQLRRLGECLIDLYRTGTGEVEIKTK